MSVRRSRWVPTLALAAAMLLPGGLGMPAAEAAGNKVETDTVEGALAVVFGGADTASVFGDAGLHNAFEKAVAGGGARIRYGGMLELRRLGDGSCEATVLLDVAGLSTTAVLRLKELEGRWRVVAIPGLALMESLARLVRKDGMPESTTGLARRTGAEMLLAGGPVLIVVSRDAIWVDGERVVAHAGFKVDASHKKNGQAEEFLIMPLQKALETSARNRRDWARRVQAEVRLGADIAASGEMVFRLLAEVVHTAAMASFIEVSLVVRRAADGKPGVLRITVPRTAVSSRARDEPRKPLNLTILLTERWLMVRTSDSFEDPMQPGKGRIAKKDDGSYDFAALTALLTEIKKAYPKERTVNIGAHMLAPLRDVVGAMDASREDSGGNELFPHVILVVAE